MSGRPIMIDAATTLRSGSDLAEVGLIAPKDIAAIDNIGHRYAIAVTPAMVELIDRTDADDGIARQFMPDPRELIATPGEQPDPIGDDVHEVTRGLIHRYPDRVLLKLVSACAVYCRFCFRRETVGNGEGNLNRNDIATALSYIRSHEAIWEVILSGGDPLIASPQRLSDVVAELAAIDHVKVVRFHTRVPVAAPESVTDVLAAALVGPELSTWVAIHANHPRELTDAAVAALGRLAAVGANLVSQTVLLRGVNDEVETLAALMRALVTAGVKPYYIHHPDLAPGTGHFRLDIAEGQMLVEALRARVSGLCQPHYVLDIPGGYGKVPLLPAAVRDSDGRTAVTDRHGREHSYSDKSLRAYSGKSPGD